MSTQTQFGCKGILDAGGIVVRICPATSNLPTRMSEDGWTALCKSTRRRELASGSSAASDIRRRLNYCGICKGKIRPPGLEIIPAAEMAQMKQYHREEAIMGKAGGKCTACGRASGALSTCHGEKLCASCSAVYSAINNRPQVVLSGLRKLKPEALIDLAGSDPVQVSVESKALQRIAEAVGYEGGDGEVLVEAVQAMASTVPDCANCAEGMSEQVADLQNEIQLLKDKLDHAAKYPSDDLLRAFEMTDNAAMDGLELAAIQTAAMLDNAERTTSDLAVLTQAFGQEKERAMGMEAYIASVHDAAGIARDIPLEDWISALREDNAVMTERLVEIRADLNIGGLADVAACVRGAVQQARHGRELADRLAEVEAENERLNGLLDQQNDTFSLAIDPAREALADFGLAVIRGNVTVSHRG